MGEKIIQTVVSYSYKHFMGKGASEGNLAYLTGSNPVVSGFDSRGAYQRKE